MMNFAPNRGTSVEEDDRGKLPFSQYYSSSSHRGGMLPLTYQRPCPGNDSAQEDTTARYSFKSVASLDVKDAPGSEGCRRAGNCGVAVAEEREHMFDKVVTPSDVGKLNRLVIPKQHAEKYFPLDATANEKGLLLNFEDPSGKPWRFRYSYWNSSQSYVMTKGWSRFVKDKKLDAGDIVSFQRGVGEGGTDRLYIDWRRRPEATELAPSALPPLSLPHHFSFQYPWSGSAPLYLQAGGDHRHRYPALFPRTYAGSTYQHAETGVVGPCGYANRAAPVICVRSAAVAPVPQAIGMIQMQRGGGRVGGAEAMVFKSVPVVQGKAAAKRLRLFGVNMECPISESDECDVLPSATTPHATMATRHHPHHQISSSSDAAAPPLLPFQSPKMPSDLLDKAKPSMSLDFDI